MASAIGTKAAKLIYDGSRVALDLVFRDSALILNDVGTILGGTPLPVPLIGFSYEAPSAYTLLRYEYSEYPYLNRQSIVSGYVKNNTELTIRSYRALTTGFGLLQAIAINKALLYAVEKYCDNGGRFSLINTYDGLANNLLLQELKIIPSDTGRIDMLGLEWTFKKVLFAADSVVGTLADKLAEVASGKPA